MSKKPRGDSKFLNLDEDVQEQIIETIRKAASLDEAVPAVAEKFGVKSSRSGLSVFWSQWHLRNRFKTFARESDETVRLLKEIAGTDLSDQKASQFAQRFFELKSLREDDPKMFAMIQSNNLQAERIAVEREKLALSREKFQFSAAAAVLKHADKVRVIVDGPGSDEAKTEQLGQLIFEEAWK